MEPCKPMLGNFVNIYENDSKKAKTESGGIHRPLHLNPVFYEDDSSKAPKKVSREKRRAAKRLLDDADLMEEEDLPVEIYFGSSNSDRKFVAKLRERERYEEENFTRVPLSKKERLMQKRMERGEFLDTSTRMDYIRKLLESSDDEEEIQLSRAINKKKKHKRPKRGKGGKKFGKRKR
uniref:DUF2040 domain-containing protein n=1 Tax=Mesocestoides corti TaxID=53468 RepID=A0A5K3FUI7_MESCO